MPRQRNDTQPAGSWNKVRSPQNDASGNSWGDGATPCSTTHSAPKSEQTRSRHRDTAELNLGSLSDPGDISPTGSEPAWLTDPSPPFVKLPPRDKSIDAAVCEEFEEVTSSQPDDLEEKHPASDSSPRATCEGDAMGSFYPDESWTASSHPQDLSQIDWTSRPATSGLVAGGRSSEGTTTFHQQPVEATWTFSPSMEMDSATPATCRFYAQGLCRKGDSCPFYHLGRTNERPPDLYPHAQSGASSVKPCRYFRLGSCRHGDHCTYSHMLEDQVWCDDGQQVSHSRQRGLG
jgi:hypothetical protein